MLRVTILERLVGFASPLYLVIVYQHPPVSNTGTLWSTQIQEWRASKGFIVRNHP